MDYEKAYNEALERAKKTKEFNGGKIGDLMEHIFPELRESEDEKIRKEIIEYLNSKYEDPNAIRHDYVKWISWLEKQKEVKMIQWTGDNLKEVTNFTGLSPEFSNWFKSWDDFESYVHSHNDVFKLFFEDGSHYEVPKGAWIVRTPNGYNVASRSKFVEKQGEQKPADKIESKFKVGDWVINKQGIVHQIANVIENVTNHIYGYDIVGGGYFNDNTEGVRLWTIQDAKDGDVFVAEIDEEPNDFIYIFKEYNQNLGFWSHCYLDAYFNKFHEGIYHNNLNVGVPATKEQRDLLFKKMKEAGYEWDAEKKELKKIEQKPTWSEEDEKFFKTALWHISNSVSNGKDMEGHCATTEWLKSIKDRVSQPHWKPSEEQLEALWGVIPHLPNCEKDVETITELTLLYDELKNL